MLTFEQIRAIEVALGPEAARPVVEAFQTTDSRVMTSLLAEVATKADLAQMEGRMDSGLARVEGRMDSGLAHLEGRVDARLARLEVMVKVLIGLALVAITMFSPNLAELIRLAK